MKKLILMIVLGVSFTSCVETQNLPHCQTVEVAYSEDPNKELFEIWEKEKSEGVLYYKFKGKFYTETQMDSIDQVINDLITKKMIEELDSTGSLQ
jgi:hypothetical protein